MSDDNKVTVEVGPELVEMAHDILELSAPYGSATLVLERALRVGLAHLLVLEEENAKWRMKYGD